MAVQNKPRLLLAREGCHVLCRGDRIPYPLEAIRSDDRGSHQLLEIFGGIHLPLRRQIVQFPHPSRPIVPHHDVEELHPPHREVVRVVRDGRRKGRVDVEVQRVPSSALGPIAIHAQFHRELILVRRKMHVRRSVGIIPIAVPDRRDGHGLAEASFDVAAVAPLLPRGVLLPLAQGGARLDRRTAVHHQYQMGGSVAGASLPLPIEDGPIDESTYRLLEGSVDEIVLGQDDGDLVEVGRPDGELGHLERRHGVRDLRGEKAVVLVEKVR
mmetsp:Transcript_7801/g.22976  ORF Transcript_7801/g.22976 Transcript_7801/m.22976 type:complete len:269 (+) Transcript_7801:445-1251(+)